jgi:hypothetical protein
LCNGTKSDSYIIHHIEQYAISQNNSYHNLAVLCPNDHDLAHKEGFGLTLKITPDQIKKSKIKWEKVVQDQKVYKASINGNIDEVEFLNVPRILELSKEIFRLIPETEYTKRLILEDLIKPDGYINTSYIKNIADNPATPLIFFALYGSAMMRFHYFEIFKKVVKALNFKDLDSLLNIHSIKEGIAGEYCFYVGGLYSSKLPSPITDDSEMMRFYFKRKSYVAEWFVDPQYFASSSAKYRTSHRNILLIYGKIKSVNIEMVNDKRKIVINMQTYCFGLPSEAKNRRPDIAFQRELEQYFNDENEDVEITDDGFLDDIDEKDLPF